MYSYILEPLWRTYLISETDKSESREAAALREEGRATVRESSVRKY